MDGTRLDAGTSHAASIENQHQKESQMINVTHGLIGAGDAIALVAISTVKTPTHPRG